MFIWGVHCVVTTGCEGNRDASSDTAPVSSTVSQAPRAERSKSLPVDAKNEPERVWYFDELFRIGNDENSSKELFQNDLMTVVPFANGQTLILELSTSRIIVFDVKGGYTRSISRRGSGPGELNGPTAMAVDRKHRIWVAEAFQRRYSVFDSLGMFVKTTSRPFQGTPRLPHQMVFTEKGFLVDEVILPGRTIGFVHRAETVETFDTAVRLARPHRPRSTQPLGDPADREALAYLPSVVWTLGADGTVWSTPSDAIRISHMRNGQSAIKVSANHRNLDMPALDRRKAEQSLSRMGVPPNQIDLVRPIVAGLLRLDDGRILVNIVQEVGKPSNLMDVFSSAGEYLGALEIPLRLSPRAIHASAGDTLWLVTLGEEDQPIVVKGVLRRAKVSLGGTR